MKYWKKGRSVSASTENEENHSGMDRSSFRGHSRNVASHSWKYVMDADTSSRSLSTITGLRPRPVSDTLCSPHSVPSVISTGTLKQSGNDSVVKATATTPKQHTELLERYTDSIKSPCIPESTDKLKGLTPQHILICNNYFLRLVHESYEQLQTLHYRASLEFSLAEWMHVHSLMLYSRIQRVRQSFKPTNGENEIDFRDWNLIDLDSDVLVFSPIATALSAIGAVEDTELGVMYIPDAIFPSSLKKAVPSSTEFDSAELSSLEVKHILNGTLYDWQRSWTRVLEFREKRALQLNSRSTIRSTTELIAEIQETTRSISRMRQLASTNPSDAEATNGTTSSSTISDSGDDNTAKASSETKKLGTPCYDESALTELNRYERQLTELIEEARNAKDYTIHPPCDSVFDWSCMSKRQRDSILALNSADASHEVVEKESIRLLESDTIGSESPRVPCVVPTKFLHRRITTNELESQLIGLINADNSTTKDGDLGDKLTDNREKDTPSEFEFNTSSTSSDSAPSRIEINSEADCSPHDSIQTSEIFTDRQSELGNPFNGLKLTETDNNIECRLPSPPPRFPFGSLPGTATKPMVLSDIPAPPRPRPDLRSKDTTNAAPAFYSIELQPHEVQNSIPYDNQLWKDYKRFVERLRERQQVSFEVIKKGVSGSHAWVLKVNMPKRQTNGEHRPQLIMPRQGIPSPDQILSLILQTSYPGAAISQSWHIERYAEVDVPKLLHEYVKAGVCDQRIN